MFIVAGSALDGDSEFVKLSGLSQSELTTIQRIVTRQGGLDFVVRQEGAKA